jgi:hypothetical protein
MQLQDLRQYAAARGWAVFDEYIDTGWSGKNADRPALKRCVAEPKARKFDATVNGDVSRVGSSIQFSMCCIATGRSRRTRWWIWCLRAGSRSIVEQRAAVSAGEQIHFR